MDSRKAYSPLRHGPAFFSACSTRLSSRNDLYANQMRYQYAPEVGEAIRICYPLASLGT